MDDPERHRRGAYHTGAAFERGDVHRQHGVERLPCEVVRWSMGVKVPVRGSICTIARVCMHITRC